ncbi:hypothetical protein ACFSC4_29300 [Deinococcus malanensis]
MNTALLWGARSWGAQAGRMWRVSVAALVVTLGAGWPVLALAQEKHNALLRRSPQDRISVQASPAVLHVRQCLKRLRDGPCVDTTLNFPNPTAWGVAGLLLTGLAGLPRQRHDALRGTRQSSDHAGPDV